MYKKNNRLLIVLIVLLTTILTVSCANEKNIKSLKNNNIKLSTTTFPTLIKSYKKQRKITSQKIEKFYTDPFIDESFADYQKNIHQLNQQIESSPNESELYFLRGHNKLLLQNYQGAVQDFNTVIRLDVDNFQAYHRLSMLHEYLENFDSAIKALDRIIALNPNTGILYYSRGKNNMFLGNYQEALIDYTKAINLSIDLSVNNTLFYFDRALSYMIMNQYIKATHDLQKVIKLESNFENAYHMLGIINTVTGRFQNAIENYTRLININPNNIEAYRGRMIANAMLQNHGQVKKDTNILYKLESNMKNK